MPSFEIIRAESPSIRYRSPNLAPQMRVAFASMASNTGSSSPGDRLMTCSTSEVAVCCSSDSVRSRVRACTSSNSRTFSMAITGLVGEGLDQLDLPLAEGPRLRSYHRQDADDNAL